MTDTIINRYNLYLKSSQRTQGSNEHPTYILRRPYFKSNPFNVFEVSIKQILVPYSFFSVNSNVGYLPNGNEGTLKFNQIQWYLARGGGSYPSTTYVVGSPANPITTTIPQGNYTILTLITAIQVAMVDYLTYYYPSYTNPNWNWSYNRDTLLINFLLNGSDGITTTFYIVPSTVVDGGMAFNMGITSLINFGYNSSNQSQPITYIGIQQSFTGAFSQSSINVSPITSLMIRSNNLIQNRSCEFVASNVGDFSDIILRLPIQTVGTTLINYENQANIRNRIKNEYIDIVDLYITDNRTYDTISLNGLDWMAVLEIVEIDMHENKVNEAHNMMKDINFSKHDVGDKFQKKPIDYKDIPYPLPNVVEEENKDTEK
jgi:hypothetical protein